MKVSGFSLYGIWCIICLSSIGDNWRGQTEGMLIYTTALCTIPLAREECCHTSYSRSLGLQIKRSTCIYGMVRYGMVATLIRGERGGVAETERQRGRQTPSRTWPSGYFHGRDIPLACFFDTNGNTNIDGYLLYYITEADFFTFCFV